MDRVEKKSARDESEEALPYLEPGAVLHWGRGHSPPQIHLLLPQIEKLAGKM